MATMFPSVMESLFFNHNDPLFSSTAPTTMIANDIWPVNECQFDMPTPPVSPSHNDHVDPMVKSEPQSIDEDLDLGLGELISNSDVLSGLFLDDLVAADSWIDEVLDPIVPDVLETKCDVSELRHDCMWAGTCPAEEHRSKKDLVQLPCLLSSSPPESTVLSMATSLPCVLPSSGSRTRLDTLGSIRPETPLSLSDSELDADQLTSDEGNAKGNSSSSSSADESESDEDQMHHYQPTLPPNIHPVRSHQIRKMVGTNNNNKSLVKMMVSSSCSSFIPDHSYSHSDHSYHTQRRPTVSDLAAIPFDLGAPTPSDSGKSCSL